MDWLGERACVVPRCEVRHGCDPAHTQGNGMGSKGPDCSCVPLCREHHTEQHAKGMKVFQIKYGIDLAHEARVHYAAYRLIEKGEAE
jgi:hypothetical protein